MKAIVLVLFSITLNASIAHAGELRCQAFQASRPVRTYAATLDIDRAGMLLGQKYRHFSFAATAKNGVVDYVTIGDDQNDKVSATFTGASESVLLHAGDKQDGVHLSCFLN